MLNAFLDYSKCKGLICTKFGLMRIDYLSQFVRDAGSRLLSFLASNLVSASG